MKLENQAAIVTGAGAGIGKAIARASAYAKVSTDKFCEGGMKFYRCRRTKNGCV